MAERNGGPRGSGGPERAHAQESPPLLVSWAVGVSGRDTDAPVHLGTACGLDAGKVSKLRGLEMK